MQYRVITVQARGPIGSDFATAANELAELVSKAMAEGWQPAGGIAVGHPLGGAQPTLFQAMMRRVV
ncbi:MAG: hypothetical protein R3F56_11195 [Planctomycetota bacterium]